MAINEQLDFLVSRVEKVRKWLAAIAILKTAAICLLFACVYIGGYILLDHRINFGFPGRLFAFILLLGLTIFLIYKLSRLLLVQISYTNAANFIENNYSLNQQLVAAMEFYENKADYPYSKVLAEQLIIRVNKDSESFRFDSVVEKWRGYALAAFVSIGMAVVVLYVHHNISFLTTYFARLAVPFSSIEPIAATSLEAMTGDMVSEPESMLVFTAQIKGRIPSSGQLIIAPIEQDSNDQKIKLRPIEEPDMEPKFETTEFFPNTGQYKYRFQSGSAQTEWQNIDIREAPQIKSITAEIELPKNVYDENALYNIKEQIKNNSIEVIKNSTVTLRVETSSKLSEVEIADPKGSSSKQEVNGENTFTHTFTANNEGKIEFNLTDDKGMKSKNIPGLNIKLKTDNPPGFELVSPGSDYLATDVSSVPIEFKITDDFGLSSAGFTAEFPDGEPLQIDIPANPDSNEAEFNYVIELEKYDLHIGDSIMFYANATDIKTVISNEENSASSEIYFIEIRPYQQIWHINEGSNEPSEMPGAIPQDLMTLLEYTRAFIKKTSVLAGKTEFDTDDRSEMKSIQEDVDYSSSLLEHLRDDPLNNFDEEQKKVLNEINKYYENSSFALGRNNASEALTNEKVAYRILRKILVELEMEYNPPQSGEMIDTETPESVKLKEAIETPGIEEGQVEEELQKVQDDIEKLHDEQKELKDELQKALKKQKEANQQSKANSQAQDSANGSSESGDGQPGSESQQPSSGSGDSGNGQPGSESQQSSSGSGASSNGQPGSESQQPSSGSGDSGTGQPDSESQQPSSGSGASSNGQSGSESQQSSNGLGEGSGNSNTESQNASNNFSQDSDGKSPAQVIAEAQLKMLQAKQAKLQEEVSQLQKKLESISKSAPSASEMSKASQDVKEKLGEALNSMEEFQKKMDEMQYQPQEYDKKAEQASEMMDSAAEKLNTADQTLKKALNGSKEGQLAEELKENAEMLAEDPDKLDDNLSEAERQKMEALLQRAMELLEKNPGAKTVHVSRGPGSTGSSTMNVLTDLGGGTDRDTPMEIARKFWLLAIELEKRKEQPIEAQPSDSRFVEVESDYFTNAAEYNVGDNRK